MKIGNVRLGLATNSSSTHYIVFLNKNNTNKYLDDDCSDQNYGWNEFTCAETDSKMEYLSHVLYRSVVKDVGEQYAKTIVDAWVGNGFYNEDGYIDHNSTMILPSSYEHSKSIDQDFFEEFKAFISKNNVLIIGGNDNSEPSHPAHFDNAAEVTRIDSLDSSNLVCRKDGSVWFLFNKRTGARFSLSFDESVEDFRPKAPLLVDLKITDFCLSGCNFCYQNSTSQGKHASKHNVDAIIKALEKLKVFEVAIGGGEPTEFPDFEDIMFETYNAEHIVKNFATRNSEVARDFLLKTKDLSEIPKNHLTKMGAYRLNHNIRPKAKGACALTVGSSAEIKSFVSSCSSKKLVFHYVMGTSDEKEFKNILQTCKVFEIPIILLGFKSFGRGAKFEPQSYDNWIKIVKEVGGNVGIDTALAAAYEEQLKDENVSELTYSTKETDTSMYIDAVQMTMRPSSYSDPKKAIKLSVSDNSYWSEEATNELAKQIQDAFMAFREDSDNFDNFGHREMNIVPISKITRGNRSWWELQYLTDDE
ncbi:MAG TPA: radical SAM protein [Candidatus Glassbacteria bacterium]|nr:radical SAM protein [Candidatus Glassbacteria bacterium]